MAKKKNKKRNPARSAPARQPAAARQSGLGQSGVKLSQCMIVKNEEKNIETALSWGKGIVSEQIVVDTGSTDRTVEIAKCMGAKVLNFEWISDFAAAKNFAIEQATGNWIAFLDADEYFPKEDAAKLLPILGQIMTDPGMKGKYLAVSCPMHQLNDDGKAMDVNVQVRLFRNIPAVRYYGRIHEQLSIGGPDIVRTEDISIMHTGYSDSANLQTGKPLRNVEMLREELSKRPDDLRMKLYMADSLVSYANTFTGDEGKKYSDEAEMLYKVVALSEDASLDPDYRHTAYKYLLNVYSKAAETDDEYEKICKKAIAEFPDDPKIVCFYAAVLNNKGEYSAAYDILKKLEAKQSNAASRSFAYSITDMILMCQQIVYAAQGLGDKETMLEYTAAILVADKTNANVLSIYIKLLLRRFQSNDIVLELLSMIYDISNKEDIAFIVAAAREAGATGLADLIEK